MSENEYTIPADPSARQNPLPTSFLTMNGPASSFANNNRALSLLLLPVLIFMPGISSKLDTKAAIKNAKTSKSLAWALRAWCHSNREGFEFRREGDQVDAYRDNGLYANTSPIIRAKHMQGRGWGLIRYNAIKFDWNQRSILDSATLSIPYSFIHIERAGENIGIADIVCIPTVDYGNSADIVSQIDSLIRALDYEASRLTKFYNTNKK